jgi:hypothetical protein
MCFFKVSSLLESPESPMLHTSRQPGHAVDREEASSSHLARVLSRAVAKAFLVNVILLYGVSCFLLTAQEGSKYCRTYTWNRNCRDRNHHAHTHLVNFEQTNMYNGISSSYSAVLSRSLKSCNAIPMNLEPGTCAPMMSVNSKS